MKNILATVALIALVTPAFAEESQSSIPGEFSGTIALTNDYTSRGLTQSDENPAIQGSLIYTIGLDDNFSIYAGIWGSNVDFNDGDEASIELDYSTGIGYTNDAFSLDTGFIFYEYPGADETLNYDYYEVQANVGYDLSPFYLRAAVNYTPNNASDSGDATYLKLAAEYTIIDDLKATLRGGRQYIEDNTAFGLPDYNDWGVALTYTFKEVDFTAEYVDNDIDSASCGANCNSKVLFTASKSF